MALQPLATITPQAITSIGTAVLGVTQLLKWSGLPPKHAPLLLAFMSLGCVLMWVYKPFWFEIMAATTIVTMSASGVYGFVTRQTPPPVGGSVVSTSTTTTPPDKDGEGGQVKVSTTVDADAVVQKKEVVIQTDTLGLKVEKPNEDTAIGSTE